MVNGSVVKMGESFSGVFGFVHHDGEGRFVRFDNKYVGVFFQEFVCSRLTFGDV